ncbi:MAG TPA: nucleoside hydrolase [Roseiflexaceae bacterium]|nr:nucleoside hydrolase [Roseiflexaceae bacterium]
MTRKLIIDTDCGIDDALAMLMALADPSVEIIGITCVSGNVELHKVLRNVGIVLDAVGAGAIPIYSGASRPLLMPPVHAGEVHGGDGLGDAGFPDTTRRPEEESAVEAIVRLARTNPGAILVPLGPLTNVALALAIEPDLPQMLGGTVIMGGAFNGIGNASAAAEFNIWADPEAAAMVFDRGLRPTVLDWEVTAATPISWAAWDRLMAAGQIGERFIGPMNSHLQGRARERGRPGILMPDPLAMAVVLDEACAQIYDAAVAVDTGWSAARGMTTVDKRWDAAPPNARIVSSVDSARFEAMIERTCALPCRLAS